MTRNRQLPFRIGLLALLLGGCAHHVDVPKEPVPGRGDPIPVHFTDVAAASGIHFVDTWGSEKLRNVLDTTGAGGGFFDYDNDGKLDLYLVQGGGYAPDGSIPPDKTSTSVLYHNEGNGRFVDVTATANVGNRGFGMGCTAADYDNDGDEDLFVTNYGRNVLYRNNGDGTFTDVTEAAGLDKPLAWSTGAAWGDV